MVANFWRVPNSLCLQGMPKSSGDAVFPREFSLQLVIFEGCQIPHACWGYAIIPRGIPYSPGNFDHARLLIFEGSLGNMASPGEFGIPCQHGKICNPKNLPTQVKFAGAWHPLWTSVSHVNVHGEFSTPKNLPTPVKDTLNVTSAGILAFHAN